MESLSTSNPINSHKDKAEALDFVFENAFKAGFGALSKSELDAILFAAIMKFSAQEHTTDLHLSKYLQITQRKVRNLKEAVSVKYLQIGSRDAINYFVEKLSYAKKDGYFIDVPINDIAVKNEIEGLLDEYNILLHSQLNSKIFRVRIDDLYDLLIIFEAKMSENQSVDDIKAEFAKRIRDNEVKLKKHLKNVELSDDTRMAIDIKKMLYKSGVDIGLEVIKAIVPGSGIAINIIDKLINNFVLKS